MENGTTIVRAEVENLYRLKFARLEVIPGEGLVRVTGKNGSGKTSLLRAIRAVLGGAGEVLPDVVNEGSEDGKGYARVELTNGYTIERRFTESAPKGYLTVTGPDGGEHKQAKINEWLGGISFDVLALFDLPEKRMRELLLSLGGDPDLATKLDGLRTERSDLYDQRTPHIAEQRRTKAIPRPEGNRPEPVDVSGEMERLDGLRRAQVEFEREQRELVEAREYVERMELELAGARANLASQEGEGGGGTDQTAEIIAVNARIREADARNAAIEPWRRWDGAQDSHRVASAEAHALTNKMEGCDTAERGLIAGAGIPVPGLTFAENGSPQLNGRDLAVASGAERIKMAVLVALAVNPELRVVLVDEANDLDLDMIEELDRQAKEHGFQVWAARIGLEGPGEIVVVDGEATDHKAA